MSTEQEESEEETRYLLSNPRNAAMLLESIAQADRGEVIVMEFIDGKGLVPMTSVINPLDAAKLYIATMHKDDDSCYGVSFPDFPGCCSAGNTAEEAYINAIQALHGHVELMTEDGDDIPEARTVEQLKNDAQSDDFVAALREDAYVMSVPLVRKV